MLGAFALPAGIRWLITYPRMNPMWVIEYGSHGRLHHHKYLPVGKSSQNRRASGCLDVLINNAAAYVDWTELASAADLAAAEAVLESNLFGAWRTIKAFLPLLRHSSHPRIVNASSGAGSHGDQQFGLTRRGGAAASYGISKAAQNALTSTLAAELADTPILIDAACPGLTATWPGAEQMGARPITEGAASIVWAATLPDDGPGGGLFRDGHPLPW